MYARETSEIAKMQVCKTIVFHKKTAPYMIHPIVVYDNLDHSQQSAPRAVPKRHKQTSDWDDEAYNYVRERSTIKSSLGCFQHRKGVAGGKRPAQVTGEKTYESHTHTHIQLLPPNFIVTETFSPFSLGWHLVCHARARNDPSGPHCYARWWVLF